ncbi:hypothetical protein HF086_018398 [Spodoptera exigua]|uniref:Uncharacterized protein n=1 Tax=Spodoptera exigua TaxID=7107 RepID=A0A922SJV6_SPOEX|nr:hypothetical protein HF086_018398 [Spodoptera exigua]
MFSLHLLKVFTNATPEHWCAPPPELDHLGLPDQLLRSLTVPGEQGTYESCAAYDIDRKELREALRDFVIERTVTTKEGNAFHTQQIYQMVAVSDERRKELAQDHVDNEQYFSSYRYGRRPTILLMVFLEVPLAIASSFATSFWTYVGLRVAGGLFFPALYQLPFILALELMPPGQRNHTG